MRRRLGGVRFALSVQRKVQLDRRNWKYGQVPDALRSGSFDDFVDRFWYRRQRELKDDE